MKVLESAENYLESILILRQKKGTVRAIDIVNYLGFSKPSVSIALKQLETNGFITRDDDNHVHLTESGQEIAESIYERHQLLSTLFMKIGVSEETALEDACKIEHHISQETIDCLKTHLDSI